MMGMLLQLSKSIAGCCMACIQIAGSGGYPFDNEALLSARVQCVEIHWVRMGLGQWVNQ